MSSIPEEVHERKYVPTPDVEKAIARIGVLMASERDVIVTCRFEIGDIFNRNRLDSGPRAEHLMERYGDADFKFIKHCAWVAYKWDKKDRKKGLPWRYFRDNSPGGEKRSYSMPTYEITDSRWETDHVCVVGMNVRGKLVGVRGTLEQFKAAVKYLEQNAPEGTNQ